MKWVILALVAAFPGTVRGQGTIYFNNLVTGVVEAPVFGNEPTNPSLAKTGNRSEDVPQGSQTYGGSGLAGPSWIAQLYGGPLGTSDAALIPVFPATTFRSANAAGFIYPVQCIVEGVRQGESARLQLRVFDSTTGPNYDQALNRGASLSFNSLGLGGGLFPPSNLVGLTAFNVAVVPEPSTVIFYFLTFVCFFACRLRHGRGNPLR